VVSVRFVVFWDVTSPSVAEVYRCFGGTYCLHLQVQRVRYAVGKKEAANNFFSFPTLRLTACGTWSTVRP
jgi:hypothetical protein